MGGTRSKLLRGLVLAWIALAVGVFLFMLVRYGLMVFTGVPLYDDWAFLETVRQYSQDETGIGHIFDRHNGHPSVPARVGYLLMYAFNDMGVEPLRWAAMAASVLGAGLVSFMLVRATSGWRREEGANRSRLLHPAVFIGVPVCSALFLSLGHWETYSVAMCVSNIIVTVCAVAGFLVFDRWINTRGRLNLALALLIAVAATLSMTQGMLVWPVYAMMLVVQPDWRRLRGLAMVLLLIFLATVIWNFAGFGAGNGFDAKKNFLHFLLGPFLLLGSSIVGLINNAVFVPVDFIVGFVFAPIVLFAFLASGLVDQDRLRRALPFIALLVYGAGTMVLISWGRQKLIYEAIAAPRYATMMLPAIAGTVGALCIFAEKNRWAGHLLGAATAILAVGLTLTNQQENVMAPFRADLLHRLDDKLRDPASARTPDWFMTEFFVNPEFAEDAAHVTPFLEQHKQSIFAEPPALQPAQ